MLSAKAVAIFFGLSDKFGVAESGEEMQRAAPGIPGIHGAFHPPFAASQGLRVAPWGLCDSDDLSISG